MATAAGTSELPDYAPELAASYRAHRVEMREMIQRLPISPGQRVLDMACGDGQYSRLLAARVGPCGMAIGADVSQAYLDIARRGNPADDKSRPQFVAARIESPPFPAGSFDLVWCAHSLVSFHRPEFALKQMARLVRLKGWVVVLENDSLHEALLPWPADLELAIRQAELQAYGVKSRRPEKPYLARRIESLLTRAGLAGVRRETWPIDRCQPLSRADTEYLYRYLLRLRKLVWPFLDRARRLQFGRMADPDSATFLAAQPGFAMTWFEVVCSGQKIA